MIGDRSAQPVRFEVLGPLTAWHADTRLDLGSVRRRTVLAVLLLHANQPMSREQIIEAVWGSSAPAYAVNLLQKHLSALRRVLEPARPGGAPSRLLTWTDGHYRLSVDAQALDLEMFEGAVHRARAARGRGDLDTAAEALHQAIRLWRGPAFDDLPSPLLDAKRRWLAERRVGTVEERVEVDLALGKHLDVVAELQQLVADHPLRERLRGLLMLALYRSGRQAEALSAFRDARRDLIDELGIEPGPELQRLHQRILSRAAELDHRATELDHRVAAIAAPTVTPPGDAAAGARNTGTVRPAQPPTARASATPRSEIDVQGGGESGRAAPDPDPPVSAPRPPIPAQLPPGMPDFTGRDAELDQLNALLKRQALAGNTVLITILTGTAGVGKSALAVRWAHQIRDRFPDGQLYVNLRGFEPTGSAVDPAEAIRGFLDAFAVPPQLMPLSLESRAALYRSLLSGRRVLVVLDNARDAEQVRQLLPGAPGCLVVVTSRSGLSGLVAAEGARPVTLDLLSSADARELLAHRLGRDRLDAEPQAVEDIIASCAGLPLALTVVAARLAYHPRFPLAVPAERLRLAHGSLDAFDGEDGVTDIRAVFSWSYRRLRPEAARMFRLLGLAPGPSIGTAAAASLAGVPARRAAEILASLAQAHLVDEQIPGRFTMHDLLRAYAAERVAFEESESERAAALHRTLDHYLHSAHAADRRINPRREPLDMTPASGDVTPETFADQGLALAWFTEEHPMLLHAVERAASAGLDGHVCQLAWALTTFFDRRGHWYDSATTQRAALAAARRLADPFMRATAHRGLARASIRLGQNEDAHRHLSRALCLFQELGDHTGRGRTHLNFGVLLASSGANDDALSHAERALEVFTAAANRVGVADALNAIGWYRAHLGRPRETLAYCRQALALQQELGDREGEACTWDSLGYAHRRLGDAREAITCYERARTLWGEAGDRYNEATMLIVIGDIRRDAGETAAASTAWRLARGILDEFDHPDAHMVRTRLKEIGHTPVSSINGMVNQPGVAADHRAEPAAPTSPQETRDA